jgi:DNA-binding IclR family transcriptional regulator
MPVDQPAAIEKAQTPRGHRLFSALAATRPQHGTFTIPLEGTAKTLRMAPGTIHKAIHDLEALGYIKRAGLGLARPGMRSFILHRFCSSRTSNE